MHNIETALIFAGIPALIVGVVVVGVYAGGGRHSRRYRPGRPFEFAPVWFLAAPELQLPAQRQGPVQHALAVQSNGSARPQLAAQAYAEPAGAAAGLAPGAGEWPPAERAAHDATGGASDGW